jgi:type VI secretion system protein ImpE
MNALSSAEERLRAGAPAEALKLLQEQVRSKPQDAKLRVFLFQLLCVLGQWDRALTQLETAAALDASALAMREMYREAIKCELLRAEVFQGHKSPMVFGEPETWLALLIESLLRRGSGDDRQADALQARAFEEAPVTTGSMDGNAFDWIADADTRLGPVFEAILNGRYYWIPFERLARVTIEAPADLRDAVWMPAYLQFENGGESPALIPSRYPGSESSEDGLIQLARKTVWEETGPSQFRGLGQRLLATDAGEFSLMEVRSIEIGAASPRSDQPADV